MTGAGSPTTVLIADDEPDVRAVLGRLLEAADRIRLVGSAADAEEATRLAAESRPDVALVDFDLPGGGEQTVRGILQSSPGTRVVALSGSTDPATTLAMLRAGAASYLVKGGSPDEIVAAVLRAAQGESIFAAEVAGELIGELSASLERSLIEEDEADHVRTQIRGVIDDGRIRPVYQPIVELATGTTVGFEALSRFDAEPAQPPQEWFEQAESVGLRAELETAAARLAVDGFSGRAGREFLAVNASPDSLSDLEDVAGELGSRFVVEITEHRAIDDYAAIAKRLRGLRERGARLAVDDAGAGVRQLQARARART